MMKISPISFFRSARPRAFALGFGAVLAVAGCGAGIVAVPYTPAPEHAAQPGKQASELILANTVPGCVAKPQVSDSMLLVEYLCRGAVGNKVVRFAKVDSIVVQQSGEWYRVLVHHRDGLADFDWSSKSLDDIKHLADALAALAKLEPAGDKSPSPSNAL